MVREVSLGNFCLVQISTVCNYTEDAQQNRRARRHLQGSVQRVDSLVLHLCPAATLWRTSSLSTRDHGGGVDSRLSLPCYSRGWHTGPTRDTTYRQKHYRWGAGSTPGPAAHCGVRGIDQCSPQTQGRSEAPSGSILSWTAAVRSRWHSVLSYQHAPSQKANAQGAKPARAGSVSQSWRGRHGGTGPAQSAGRRLGCQRGIGDGIGRAGVVGTTGQEPGAERPLLWGGQSARRIVGTRRAAFFGAGEKETQATFPGGLSRWQRSGGDYLGQGHAPGARARRPGAARRAGGRDDGAFVDQPAGLAPAPSGRVAGVVCPTLGARGLLQGTQSGHTLDSLSAKPHAFDGHPKAAAQILPAGLTPAGEQLAKATEKHLPQRNYRILDWRNLCLNPYTALRLAGVSSWYCQIFVRHGCLKSWRGSCDWNIRERFIM